MKKSEQVLTADPLENGATRNFNVNAKIPEFPKEKVKKETNKPSVYQEIAEGFAETKTRKLFGLENHDKRRSGLLWGKVIGLLIIILLGLTAYYLATSTSYLDPLSEFIRSFSADLFKPPLNLI